MKIVHLFSPVLAATLFFGCRPAPKPEAKPTLASASETQIVLYRNDGFRPAIVSEWIQVLYEITHKIAKILYWNTADESPVQLKILNQNYISGEISGYTGFPAPLRQLYLYPQNLPVKL